MTHREIKPRRRLKRVGTIGVAIFVIPAIAIAIVTYVLQIQGSFTTGDASVKYITAAGVTTNSGTCSGNYIDDQKMNFSWPTPFPGEECNITVVVGADGNTVDMKLQGVTLNGSTLTGTLDGDCGKLLTVGDPLTPGISLHITLDPATPTATLVTWLGTGFEWVPAVDYNPALCA